VTDEDEWNDDDDGDDESTVPCPYCKRPVYEDSPRCPHCGECISEEDTCPARKPWWVVVGVLLVLLILLLWIIA
jgi:hypothetical protein